MVLDSEQTQEGFLGKVYRKSHSQKSVNTYNSAVRCFNTFCLSKYNMSKDAVISKIHGNQLSVYHVLDNFVDYLDKLHKSANTVYTYYTGVKKYLRHHDVEIYSEKARDKIVLPTKQQILDAPLTRETIARILNQCNPKLRSLVLVLLSSGMRIGEAVALRVRNIEFVSNPVRVLIPAAATKNNRQRETYISLEAAQALKDYLQHKIKRIDQLVFSKNDNIHVAESDMIRLFRHMMRQMPDLDGIIEGSNNRHAIHLHSFRKFFFTVGTDQIGEANTHALMGHSFYMDTYYRKPQAERMEMYQKLEPYLTIGNSDTLRKELDSKYKNQANDIEKLKQELEHSRVDKESLKSEILNEINSRMMAPIMADPQVQRGMERVKYFYENKDECVKILQRKLSTEKAERLYEMAPSTAALRARSIEAGPSDRDRSKRFEQLLIEFPQIKQMMRQNLEFHSMYMDAELKRLVGPEKYNEIKAWLNSKNED